MKCGVVGNMVVLLRNLVSMKVKDVLNYLKLNLSWEKVMSFMWLWLYKYNEKYI